MAHKGNMILGLGLPRTGTTTLRAALKILDVPFENGDLVHFRNDWDEFGYYILTERESPETWARSVIKRTSQVSDKNYIRNTRLAIYGAEEFQPWFIHVYNKHNDLVKKLIPKDRLLVVSWDNGDGWNELCEFLGVPIPDAKFPHKNKSK